MSGIITQYVLHVLDCMEGKKKNLFSICCQDATRTKLRDYENTLMRTIVRAMKKECLIVNHGTLMEPELEEVLPDLASKIRKEAVRGRIPFSTNGKYDFSIHLEKLQNEQPILESIRKRVYEYFLDSKTED